MKGFRCQEPGPAKVETGTSHLRHMVERCSEVALLVGCPTQSRDMTMLRILYQLRHSVPRRVEEVLTRRWYEYLSRMDRGGNMLFMNHGFADLDPDAESISLHAEDQPNRYRRRGHLT